MLSDSPAFPPVFSLAPLFFFFPAPATTDIYTLSLHDALPICIKVLDTPAVEAQRWHFQLAREAGKDPRSEEHTSELQSLTNLVCRLLLEKKKRDICTTARGKNVRQETRPQHARTTAARQPAAK